MRVVVAEQDSHPYKPLSIEPYRIHLFFGYNNGWNDLLSLAHDLLGLRGELSAAVFGNVSGAGVDTVLYQSRDCLHDNDAEFLDAMLCTMHWWAWKATESPIHIRPRVFFGGTVFDADYMDDPVTSKLSFSYIDRDVFTCLAASLDLFLRFLNEPPDLVWKVRYPPPARHTKRAVNITAEQAAVGQLQTNGQPQPEKSKAMMRDIVLDNESREMAAEAQIMFIVAEAGQIWRRTAEPDWGIDGEIEFKDNQG